MVLTTPLLGLSFVGHWLLIPPFKALGASWVTALVATIGAIAGVFAVYRHWQVWPPVAKCLEAIAQLDYPRDRFEVIVVDDGSPMLLEPVVAPFQEQLTLKLIRQSNAGQASARNTGAAQATGQFLVFTDDDCQPAPN